MKKSGILNPFLLYEIASLGHKDIFVIADAGLPIPEEITRIDLSLIPGIPRFLDVLEAVLKEVVVEKAVLAREITEHSPQIYREIIRVLRETQGFNPDKDVVFVEHEVFKRDYVKNARFVVRTGEFTPYSNIALIAGVPF
ncbi:MAG: D-ribose pyranase [Thermoprotei archaeon]